MATRQRHGPFVDDLLTQNLQTGGRRHELGVGSGDGSSGRGGKSQDLAVLRWNSGGNEVRDGIS